MYVLLTPFLFGYIHVIFFSIHPFSSGDLNIEPLADARIGFPVQGLEAPEHVPSIPAGHRYCRIDQGRE
jgi:hypothetical protein